MTTKVLVLGSTGMLGNAVGRYFLNSEEYDTLLSYRNKEVAYGGERAFRYDPLVDWVGGLPKADYVLNCIGAIKPAFKKSVKDSIWLNAVFPHILADHCKEIGAKLIHITTDCVFSGIEGDYDEDAKHDALDDYGKSKSLGEPTNCMVLRTSIIGQEIHNQSSLIAWAFSQRGKEVNGFADHIWNGVSTSQYADICDQIIRGGLYEEGIFHVFSNQVTKSQLLRLINDHFKLDLKINSVKAPEPCDRSLSTVKELMGKLKVPTIEEQIARM